jgi:hypothetical protein
MHIPIAFYVSKIPSYYCCGNSDRVLFVGLLIAIVSLLYKLTVNCCQLYKLSLFDCAILLSYQWRAVCKKTEWQQVKEGLCCQYIDVCVPKDLEHLYARRRVKIFWNSGYTFTLIQTPFSWYETQLIRTVDYIPEYGLRVYPSFERIYVTRRSELNSCNVVF